MFCLFISVLVSTYVKWHACPGSCNKYPGDGKEEECSPIYYLTPTGLSHVLALHLCWVWVLDPEG